MTEIEGGQLKLLSDGQIDELHTAAMTILEEKGLMVESDEALELFEVNGADVDWDEQIVKIPRSLVEKTAETAPGEFDLCGQDEANDVTLRSDNSIFSTGTGVTSIEDWETGERRKPTREDVSDAVRLTDALPNVDVSWAFFTLRDDPMLGFHNLYSLLTENTKHSGIVTWYGGELTQKLIDMIDIVADGPVDERPLVTMYEQPVSPLSFRRENVESILRWTEAGLPMIWYPGQKPGATSPVTQAGNVAQGLAETLGGNALAQLNNPGTPIIMGFSPLVMNLQTGINTYFSAETLLLQAASAQLGDYYDIPIYGHGGTTNAYTMDFQAGMESALTLYGAVLTGQNFVHDLGFAGRGDVGSLELITLTDEMIEMVQHAVEGMPVNGETLALDVIQNVDHGDNFLAESHTKEHGREALYLPELLDAVEESQWEDNRSVEKAREKTERLLAEANPDPVSEDVKAELDDKMAEARDLADELDRL